MACTGTWRRACVAILLAAACAGPAHAAAPVENDTAAVLERRVKGALLYRFVSYVNWPPAAFARPDSPLVIGILGHDALAAELESFAAGRRIDNRPIVVRRLPGVEQIKDLHVLFIGRGQAVRLPAAARAAGMTLIVTEWPGALDQGSAINFVIVDGQVRFEVGLEAARGRKLQLSSRLLAVAHNFPEVRP